VNVECYVEGVRWNPGKQEWDLHTRGDNTTLGGQVSARNVVFALPAPQAASILERSAQLTPPLTELAKLLHQTEYNACLSIMFGSGRLSMYDELSAILATSAHPLVGWFSFVDRVAPSLVPDWDGVIMLQIGAETSETAIDWPENEIIALASQILMQEFDFSLPTLRWINLKRWKYSTPKHIFQGQDVLDQAAQAGIYVCGDFLVPHSGVEAAFLSGYSLATKH
jgi:hypothetical protein